MWIFVGVVSVILAIGIVIKSSDMFTQENKVNEIIWAIEKMQVNLNFVCKSPAGTKIVTEVNLPAGAVMSGEDDRICITWQEEIRCRFIECEILVDPIAGSIILDLDTDIAKASFDVSSFGCAGIRKQDGIEIECQG